MKRTHLYELHINDQAKMLPFGGWDMPIQYGAIKDEVEAVRTCAGMFDTSHMGMAIIDGEDHAKLVDYIQTNNFLGAAEGKAVYGLMCLENGGVADDLISYKVHVDHTLICVNAGNTDQDYQMIREAIKRKGFKANLKPLTDFGMIALQGPKAAEYLTRLKGFNVEAIASLKKMRVTILGDMYVARSGYTGEDGFEIFAPKTNAISIWKELAAMGVVKCGLGARDVLRIEAAFPLYGHEITAELSPFDADLGRYVDMNKNDFAGKKALQTRPIKYKRVLFSVAESIPRQGFEIILENKVVGLVTSGTLCAKLNRGVGLGLIEEGYSFSENSLMIKIRNRETAAKIHSKNFLQ